MLITKVKCPSDKISIKCPYEMDPEYISVHNTANDASAMSEISYMLGRPEKVSFHFAVDDYRAVQGIELNRNGWHAGDGNGTGNRKSIGIEICYSKSGGSKFEKAEKNTAELVAYLLKARGWGIDRVKKHQDWSGKYCPHRTLDLGWDRFIKMIEAKLNCDPQSGTQSSPQSDTQVNVFYRVKTLKHGWLPEVKNLEDYAGWENSPITGVAIKVDKGSIKYRVHIKGGQWLPYVTGYDINNSMNGWAGNNLAIDLIEVYYYTPDNVRPFKKIYYRANGLPWQSDNDKNSKMDGYAGIIGKNITKLEMYIK